MPYSPCSVLLPVSAPGKATKAITVVIDRTYPESVSDSWSAEEVASTIADYLAMLTPVLSGNQHNKAEHNRSPRQLLNDRSKGAIEFKHAHVHTATVPTPRSQS